MRKIVIFLFVASLVTYCSCIYAQNNQTNMQIVEMLNTFYTAHNYIWSIKPPLISGELERKLDSLNAKYCTSKLRNKAKKSLEGDYGQDILTNDLPAINSFENFKIENAKSQENVYIVSYTTSNLDASRKLVNVVVIIHIEIIEEKGTYKISNVW